MTFVAVYAIVVAVLMIAQWSFFLATGRVPEARTEPVALRFHLAAEGATALALLVGGGGLLLAQDWGRVVCLVALGMLLYTALVSPGYFAQRGAWPLVGMFALLCLLALACLGILFAA